MVAVWQRERAGGIWIWNARWVLEACAHHLQAERSGAKARWEVAGGGFSSLRSKYEDQVVKAGALGNVFSNMHFQRLWQFFWGHYNL